MAFDKIVENKIREAMNDGKFDGIGRPEPIDLEAYFQQPVELRLAHSVLKSAGVVPEEVELLKEVDRLRRELDAAADPSVREGLNKSLALARLRLDVALERHRRSKG